MYIIIILLLFIIFAFYPSPQVTEAFSVPINFKYPTYIINLSETAEGRRRWPIIHDIYPSGKKWPAVYGKTFNFQPYYGKVITPEWDMGLWKNGKSKIVPMSDGEKGVAMSHYQLWKKIAKSSQPHVILEDDAIEHTKYIQEILEDIYANIPKDFDMYLLGYVDLEPKNTKYRNAIVKQFVLLHSYIVTPKGAQKLLDKLPINMPVDSWISSLTSDLKIYRHNYGKMRKKGYYSLLIKQKRNEKQIVNTNII